MLLKTSRAYKGGNIVSRPVNICQAEWEPARQLLNFKVRVSPVVTYPSYQVQRVMPPGTNISSTLVHTRSLKVGSIQIDHPGACASELLLSIGQT